MTRMTFPDKSGISRSGRNEFPINPRVSSFMVGPTAVQSSAGLRRPWAATPRTAAMSWDRVERGADEAIFNI